MSTICIAVSAVTLLLAVGVWKLRPDSLGLAMGTSRQGQLTNVNTHTPHTQHSDSTRSVETETPATRPYPVELSDRDNVSSPSQGQKQLTTSSKRTKFKTPAHRRSTKRRNLLSIPILACILNLLWVSVPTATAMLSTINSASLNATAESTLHHSLHLVAAPCWFPDLQRHKESPDTACSYLAQDLHSYAFSSTGQTETLDPFQGPLSTHQLLSQQLNNSDANLTELPHRKGGWIALKAVHSPAASVPGLGAPSTIKSKSMKSTQRSEQSLQCKSLADFQKMLLPQVALTISLGMQASNPSTSFAEKHDIKTCAHCLPPTIQRSNTTRLNIASLVQHSQRAIKSAPIEVVSTKAMQYCSQHLRTNMHYAHPCTESVWLAMYKSAMHDSDRVLMPWPLNHVERMLLATPTTSCLACLVALKTTVTDHLSEMHLRIHSTFKCMSNYVLAVTLLTCQATKILLMTIWISLAMFATALQTTHPVVDRSRRQIRTPWLAQTTQCITHMLWLLLMILRHAASNVHSIAAIHSAIILVQTQHALVIFILIFQVMCAIMQLTPVVMLVVQQTIQQMMPPNRHHRKFAHPKLKGSRYWRRIRYIHRRHKGQPLYRLFMILLQVQKKLHQFHLWKETVLASTNTAVNTEPERSHADREQTAHTHGQEEEASLPVTHKHTTRVKTGVSYRLLREAATSPDQGSTVHENESVES